MDEAQYLPGIHDWDKVLLQRSSGSLPGVHLVPHQNNGDVHPELPDEREPERGDALKGLRLPNRVDHADHVGLPHLILKHILLLRAR